MFRTKYAVALALTAILSCTKREETATPRGNLEFDRGGTLKHRPPPPIPRITEAIDWDQSAAVFIGIESFHGAVDALTNVRFAADDATDMAYLFTAELKRKIPASHVTLLLAGLPDKPRSFDALRQLEQHANVFIDGERTPLDAATIYDRVRHAAQQVGPHGVLVIFIATHGVTVEDEHLLLTPDATRSAMTGVTLAKLLQTMPSRSQTPVLLFVDACRTGAPSELAADPLTSARRFENLRFPGAYAIFAATTAGREASSSTTLQNGYFTRAVLDAMRCDRQALITPSVLSSSIDRRMNLLGGNDQRAEARFSGLNDLPLTVCKDVRVASILYPPEGARVESLDRVVLHTFEPNLYATVVVCASVGGCYNANPRHAPILTPPNADQRIAIQYGGFATIEFEVFVALTADSEFLRLAENFPAVPMDRRANRIVYWLGPIDVNLKEELSP